MKATQQVGLFVILLALAAATPGAGKFMLPPSGAAAKTHVIGRLPDRDAKNLLARRSISADNQILYVKTNWMCVNDKPTNLAERLQKYLEESKWGPCPVTTTLDDDAKLLMSKLPLNPSVPAMQALAAQGVPMELLESGEVTIFPTLTLVSSRQVNVLFTVSLIVSFPVEGKKKKAQVEYVYQLPSILQLQRIVAGLDAPALSRLQAEMAEGFTELAWLYASDSRGELHDEEQLMFHSHVINPYFDLRLEGKSIDVQRPGRYTVRTRYFLFSLPADRVEVFRTPKS